MTEHLLHARLLNAEGELIAEGPCWLEEAAGQATLEPEREPGVIQKERGDLRLELETGHSLRVSDKPMIFRLRSPASGCGQDGRRSLYRLRLISQPELVEGAPALLPREGGPRLDGETPAAPARPAGGR